MHTTLNPAKDRVRESTFDKKNAEIDNDIEKSIRYYSQQQTEAIRRRINELDSEWDIERTLELIAGLFSFTIRILKLTR